ncbi:PiggyBac transposable element-derived protein 4-like [Plakobranchus ocellatus]|uniref:PiggyBac transposable element-derived protein 4-like n=1 Tax=Plakobranchus ocellatus TaxID=259542 RepID=A0AAV4C4A2_9GAST|nr:PiggyBac transposable element-derived protein 4-like [Plakobranchus ocellatus]
MYWSKDPLLRVSAVLSHDRYQQISRYFHLADSEQFIPHGQPGHDPLLKIRPAIDQVLKSCQTYYSPGVAVSIDEAMIPFQGRLHFKQYIKKQTPSMGS